MSESQIQTKISNKLKKAGWIVLKIIQLSDNGYPDLMALKDGTTVFIEVKRKGAKPRELQAFRIRQLVKAGFKAFYTDNPDDDNILSLIVNKP